MIIIESATFVPVAIGLPGKLDVRLAVRVLDGADVKRLEVTYSLDPENAVTFANLGKQLTFSHQFMKPVPPPEAPTSLEHNLFMSGSWSDLVAVPIALAVRALDRSGNAVGDAATYQFFVPLLR